MCVPALPCSVPGTSESEDAANRHAGSCMFCLYLGECISGEREIIHERFSEEMVLRRRICTLFCIGLG